MNEIKVCRKTTESEMTVILDFSHIKPDYREYIDTTLPFLNHMIEHIAWRGGFNITAKVKLDKFLLTHVICEDLGIALGRAASEYIKRNRASGAMGYGDAVGIIDEAQAHCAVSFESRAYFDINYHGINVPAQVEGMDSQDLETFLEGFAQGAGCTMQLDLTRGKNGHHIWEAIYRSVGTALNRVLSCDDTRKNMTSGVAGQIDWAVE